MMVVSDLTDVFLPRPADLLVNLTESKVVIKSLLEKLGTLFRGNHSPTSAFGSALKYAQQLISPIGGKIVSFISSIPSIGEGILKPKDEMKLLGTPKVSLALPM
jgi:protein transport protein SEC24